jgi:oxygen-independent coproporphyrinogen III oxidase
MSSSLGVYISVPFCKAKCTFCNFASGVFAADRMQQYVDRVCDEIARSRSAAATLGAEIPNLVDTVYFGGGTPSLLAPNQIRRIFEHLRGEFTLAPDAEITLECAPGQLAEATLAEFLQQGMNRMSFGVQSFVDRESAAVGRLHTEQMCIEELARIRAAGILDLNIDLIVGLPHQTEDSWKYSLDAALQTGAPHLSVYMLEVDEDSRLGKEMLASGTRYSASAVPSEDDAASWYQLACDVLGADGLAQYEISNFARAGHQSRHNLKYWRRQPYLGFGLDAHSMLLTDTGAVRFANTSDLDVYSGDASATAASGLRLYEAPVPAPEVDAIGERQAFEESLFLGLRLNAGVSFNELRGQFGEALLRETLPALNEVRDAGLLELTADRMRLTDRGRMVSNEVFSRLLLSTAV